MPQPAPCRRNRLLYRPPRGARPPESDLQYKVTENGTALNGVLSNENKMTTEPNENDMIRIIEKPTIAVADNTFEGKQYSALINESVTGQVI